MKTIKQIIEIEIEVLEFMPKLLLIKVPNKFNEGKDSFFLIR